MPRHANQTSFKPGMKRSPESIERQRETIRRQKAEGTWVAPPGGGPWTDERRARHAATKRARALGNRRIHNARGFLYWDVMTETGTRLEHRVIMEQIIGRPLLRSEHVHHKNHDGLDNRPENLELLTAGEHSRRHHLGHAPWNNGKGSMLRGRWAMKHDCCTQCGRTEFKHIARGLCSSCYMKQYR